MIVQPIVEGPGDEKAVPILIRRVFAELIGCYESNSLRPYKLDRGKMVKQEFCSGYLQLAQLDPVVAFVMLILDADEDCCKTIKESISEWSAACTYRVPFEVICIEKEFECWLLAGIESLHGLRGIDAAGGAPSNVNQIRGAKGRITDRMPRGVSYSETADQPALTSKVDLHAILDRCPSFVRFVKKLRAAHDSACGCRARNQSPA